MTDRVPLPAQLLRERFVALLPDVEGAQVVAPIEILVQESVGTICLPATKLAVASELAAMYTGRACLGVRGVADAETADQAADAGVQFCWLARPDAGLVARLADRGVAACAPALTPTEVLAAWDTGASGVVVLPADALGTGYARWLAELAPDVPVLPAGGVAPYAARSWLEHGAVAVGADDTLIADALTGGSLPNLRERAANLARICADVAAETA